VHLPTIIQGGMGAGVSNWRLARAVSSTGELGVVSGVALEVILSRRLQDGDPGGDVRLALQNFPFPQMAQRILDQHFIPGGKAKDAPYKLLPMHSMNSSRALVELTICGHFVEVWLARQGHSNAVGINFLEKIQLPHLYAMYGAMLAGVEYVLMGAGIPLKVPGVLDALANHEAVSYPITVTGAQEGDDTLVHFNPREYMERELSPIKRPNFLAIIASNTLATTMVRKANGRVDGFVIEGPTAGGHNAPPRGKLQMDETGEPVYGERDMVDLEKMRAMGVPFWLAGGYGSPEMVQHALEQGAAGVQVGTAFALCKESGYAPELRGAVLQIAHSGSAHVKTDMLASPTGFPFKVVQLEGTSSQEAVYASRTRICDVGQLREAYRTQDGKVAFRCAAEPLNVYLAKGGTAEAAEGRKCLCNSLLSNIGLCQIQKDGYIEPAMITAGNDITGVARFARAGEDYSATDVINVLRSGLKDQPQPADQVGFQLAADDSAERVLSA
jgi:nitronate monooxygenase